MDAKKVAAAADTVKNLADKLRKDAENNSTPSSQLSERFKELQAAFSTLSAEFVAKSSTTIDQFLTTVGESVVRAQEKLDTASVGYLKNVDPRTVLPSIYRIPKISAEMKFALEKVEKEGVNIVFFSSSASSTELNQQTVQFDIVAAPPPTDYKFGTLPALSITLSALTREAIKKIVEENENVTTADTRVLLENWNEVLISPAAKDTFLIVYAGKKGTNSKNAIGCWIVVNHTLTELRAFNVLPDDTFVPLYEILRTLAVDQARLLADK